MSELSEYDVLLAEYEHVHGQPLPYPGGGGWPAKPTDDDRKRLYRALHDGKRTALCLSGGGIRSATFALGVIQRLAKLRILDDFCYLSSVSGGGYIASWLSSFAHRHPRGMTGVQEDLMPREVSSIKPEATQVKHLREYSNYLTPKLGLFSGDTWAMIGTYLRNLSLLHLVLIPLFIAVLAVPRLLVSLVKATPPQCIFGMVVGVAAVSFILALFHIAGSRPVGATLRFWTKEGDDAKPYLTNSAYLIHCILPLTICSLALVLLYAWSGGFRDVPPLWVGVAAAVTTGVLTFIYMRRYVKANEDGRPPDYLRNKTIAEVASGAISGVFFTLSAFFLLQRFKVVPFAKLPAPGLVDWLDPKTIFPSPDIILFVCFAVPLAIFALLVQATIFIAGTSWFNEEYDREWWARSGAWCLVVVGGWIVLTALSLLGPVGIYFAPRTITGIGMISGGFAVIAGRSSTTAANAKQKEKETSILGRSVNISLSLAVPIFAVCVLALLSLATTKLLAPLLEKPLPPLADKLLQERTSWHTEKTDGDRKFKSIDMPALEGDIFAAREHLYVVDQSKWWHVALLIVGAGGLSLLASFFVGVNRFSMHGLYRNRLIRAYLGASNAKRKPNPFTGFDPRDNLQMSDLRVYGANQTLHPMHVVNTALNLVGGDNLAWQERKADSFIVTPLVCGNATLGYRDSATYGGRKGISLGTAVAISGAAASPNMGYHSSPGLAFLLTFFNVRLGAWLGNPRHESFKLDNPRWSLDPLFAEVFGATDENHPYVYLSDGGHFENLGLYEMVRRRCHWIVLTDAGEDDKFAFEDLGNAIRKIRIDFGINVNVTQMGIYPRTEKNPQNPKYCAIAEICYKDVDGVDVPNGCLVYVKPVFYGKNEPKDIYNYATANQAFPHESTGDQFFGESQFESYRKLGYYAASEMSGDARSVEEFVRNAEKYAKREEAAFTKLGTTGEEW
jgi:hypothetical protein